MRKRECSTSNWTIKKKNVSSMPNYYILPKRISEKMMVLLQLELLLALWTYFALALVVLHTMYILCFWAIQPFRKYKHDCFEFLNCKLKRCYCCSCTLVCTCALLFNKISRLKWERSTGTFFYIAECVLSHNNWNF